MSEYNFQPSAYDTDRHLRPIVEKPISDEELEKRIKSLTGLAGDSNDVRVFSTPEYPWLFAASNEAEPRPREDYQEAMLSSYQSIVNKLSKLPMPIYVARVRRAGANVWMADKHLYSRFNAGLEESPTIFTFMPYNGKIAWSAVKEEIGCRRKLHGNTESDMTLLSQSPISAFMALGTIERLMDTVPSNVSWR